MTYPIPVDLTDNILILTLFCRRSKRQQNKDTTLIDGKNDLISAKFIVDYLDMQIKKVLEKNWKNYNTDRLAIELKPFRESAFRYLFDCAIQERLNKKKIIEEIYFTNYFF